LTVGAVMVPLVTAGRIVGTIGAERHAGAAEREDQGRPAAVI
jgi:hypothetical protein